MLLAGLLLVSGCIFATRSPEPPSGFNTFVWTPATTPDYLLDNFVGTLKILDAPDYMRVFIGSTDSTSGTKAFTYTPAPGLDQASLGIFTGWTVQSEGAWVSKLSSLLANGSQLTISLSDKVINQSSANSASISADYLISIPTPSSTSALPSEVEGSFQMTLAFVTTAQGTSEWRIISWSDFASSNTVPSWTNLKVTLSS